MAGLSQVLGRRQAETVMLSVAFARGEEEGREPCVPFRITREKSRPFPGYLPSLPSFPSALCRTPITQSANREFTTRTREVANHERLFKNLGLFFAPSYTVLPERVFPCQDAPFSLASRTRFFMFFLFVS